ncbi:MAG: symmetrical bis(5'-nucleosyl)-tetraphosphatase [Betaproteobacteria bacterium]|nr:symmetrical bis(5'-nucleosyl)-tetraphosphatase [Betaproteobacteria bacterium]
MIFLIGDVQGCCNALDRLLGDIGFSPSRDRLVVLGDLVNRGPDSLGVLRRLRDLGNAATCLMGNHDLHLLAVAQGVRRAHRTDTLNDILEAPDREAWLEWVRSRPLATLEAGWLCVHAGVVPAWDVAQTLHLAHEVHTMLQGSGRGDFLQSMYGNDPAQWNEQLHHHDRWRFIVNTLTRIRFCTPDSRLELATKEGLGATPEGYWPWFDVPGRRTQGHPLAFGHWSTVGLLQREDLLSLDTGCVWGGALSAMRVDGGRRELCQVSCADSPTIPTPPTPAARPD